MINNKYNVLFITNIPAPYRVDFFNLLAEYVNLTVCFELESSFERNASWEFFDFRNFRGLFFQKIRLKKDFSVAFGIKKLVEFDHFDFVFILNPLTIIGIQTIFYLRRIKKTFAIEIDGAFMKTETNFVRIFKKIIFRQTNIFLSTCKNGDEYLTSYNAKPLLLYRVPLSSVFRNDIKRTLANEKHYLRKKHNIIEKFVVLSVGRFIEIKQFHKIIEMWKIMDSDVAYIVVGEGELLNLYQDIIIKNEITNIYIFPFLNKELHELYMLSDVFLHPSKYDPWGLVINEAMAFGLPVVSTTMTNAANEMVIHGYNGYLHDFSDFKGMLSSTNYLLYNKYKMNSFSEASIEIIKNYTIESMVQGHLKFINEIIN
jgi:glycosyltransferase involved in cell wall biosynthesis